ncbi:MAG TPA: diacylglycerol kinase family protein [Actinomycetota bacterium]|nr:diacylglycerol kinase family protein [Actinomycetota bacterium]
MDRYLVIVSAGAGDVDRPTLDAVIGVLAAAGPTEACQPGDAAGLEAALKGLDGRVPVVAGGDGSLHLVVNRLRQLGLLDRVAVGLVPLGTGNDFARGAGVPLDPVAAARALATATPHRFDLLEDDGGAVVVNAAHAGLGAEAAAAATGYKPQLGPLAYPVGALIAGVSERGWELQVSVDGTLVASDARLLMVGVANGPTIGGGTPLAPEARPDDGRLDVVVVAALGPAARVAFATALRAGTHVDRDDVHYLRGTSVRISGEPVRHNTDGELGDALTAHGYQLLPTAWSLLVPQSAGAPR